MLNINVDMTFVTADINITWYWHDYHSQRNYKKPYKKRIRFIHVGKLQKSM